MCYRTGCQIKKGWLWLEGGRSKFYTFWRTSQMDDPFRNYRQAFFDFQDCRTNNYQSLFHWYCEIWGTKAMVYRSLASSRKSFSETLAKLQFVNSHWRMFLHPGWNKFWNVALWIYIFILCGHHCRPAFVEKYHWL